MARPLYTPPPASGPPTVGDPDFAAKADAYLGWFPTHGTFSDNLATWFQTEFFADLADGTPTLPAVRFKNDGNTGIYRAGPDQLAFSEGGVDRGRIYGRKNILGGVSVSGGVPTGAVIERGSNANGEYVRFADGTQICSTSITTSAAAAATWTFPSAYSLAPRLSGTVSWNAGAAMAMVSGVTTAGVDVDARTDTGGRAALSVQLIAFGRWF